jgi:hypothetical protein
MRRENSEEADTDTPSEKSSAVAAPAPAKVSVAKFVRGTLTGVDCSAPPLAMLTVVSGAKTLKMKVADTNHVILIGADQFSCGWNKKKVALNYRETSDGEENVVSLEIQ